MTFTRGNNSVNFLGNATSEILSKKIILRTAPRWWILYKMWRHSLLHLWYIILIFLALSCLLKKWYETCTGLEIFLNYNHFSSPIHHIFEYKGLKMLVMINSPTIYSRSLFLTISLKVGALNTTQPFSISPHFVCYTRYICKQEQIFK